MQELKKELQGISKSLKQLTLKTLQMVKKLEKLERKVEKEIKETLATTCRCKLVEPKTIQRSEGKAKRVIDNRKF